MSTSQKDTSGREELRRWLAKSLRLDDVPQELWSELEKDGDVDEALDQYYAFSREELFDKAKRQYDYAARMASFFGAGDVALDSTRRGRRDGGRKQRYVPALSADDPVRERAEAISLYTAKVAEQNAEVRRFREEALGGSTISSDQAEDLISSPAAAILPPAWFEENGVPLVGHSAQVLGPEATDGDLRRSEEYLLVEWAYGSRRLPLESGRDRSLHK